MTLADRVLDGLGPTFRKRAGAALPDLVEAITAPGEVAASLVETTDGGWAGAFDARVTADPAWLANATGTALPDGLTPDEQRTYLAGQAVARRGTVNGMRAAVKAVLNGSTRYVEILERVGQRSVIDGSRPADPYRFAIRVYASEVPAGGTAAIVAAALTQKPVGLLNDVDVEVLPDVHVDYVHLSAAHGTYSDLAQRFPQAGDSIQHVPEEGTPL